MKLFRHLPLAAVVIAAVPLVGCAKAATSTCALTSWLVDSSPIQNQRIDTGSQIGDSPALAQTFYVPSSASANAVGVPHIQLRLFKSGTGFSTNTGANTVSVSVFEDASKGLTTASTGAPGTQVGSTSTIDGLNIATGESFITFTMSGITVSPNITYWIEVSAAYQAGPDPSNYFGWMEDVSTTGTAYTNGVAWSENPGSPPTWTNLGTEAFFEFSVNSC